MVLDADPEARAANKTVKVKITAAVAPVLPEAPLGMPFILVAFEGMAVMPWVNDSGRLAYSIRAKGVKEWGKPSAARPAARDAA
jgi:hypothetical protein